jgi:hypothetical protein
LRVRSPDLALLKQLSTNSETYRDPLAHIDWRTLDGSGFWLPEAALSLYGLAEYVTLGVAVRQRLSHYEFVNVMCCGLWLERAFLQRISRQLDARLPRAEYEFYLHELREEAGHSLMFLKAMRASGLALPEDAWRAPRLADWLARHAPAGGAGFWLAMVIGEEVPDKFNRYVRSEAAAVQPAIAQICALHAMDEARHIAAARSRLDACLQDRPAWHRAVLALAMNALLRQIVDVFYLPPARFYELAGLTHGRWWRAMAARNPTHRRFVAQQLAPTLRMLEGYGLQARL